MATEAIDEGSGPALLVVHPGSADATSWEPVARRLTDELRVVRLQRRLYAGGATIALPHTFAAEAADVLDAAAKLDRPVLVGHSSGAVAALEAALLEPSAFRALVLYEPPLATSAPLAAGDAGPRMRAALDAGDRLGAMTIHLREVVEMPEAQVEAMLALPGVRGELERYAPAQVADDEALDALGVGIERYAALDVPAVLVEGDQSPPHLRARLADLAATLPQVEGVVTLEGEGHIAHLTAPARLAGIVRDVALRAHA